MSSFEVDGVVVEWLGHASFKLKRDDLVVYIDPYNLNSVGSNEGLEKADLVLITHGHYDHCSLKDLELIIKPGTTIIAPPDCSSQISKLNSLETIKVEVVEPFKTLSVSLKGKNLVVKTIPAYNINKQFHQRINNWVGYIVDFSNTGSDVRVYHAGDTDLIPEMESLANENITVALLPVGGTYTMNADEAAQAVSVIKPRIAVPMHYGSIVGSDSDALRFKELAGKYCEVRVL